VKREGLPEKEFFTLLTKRLNKKRISHQQGRNNLFAQERRSGGQELHVQYVKMHRRDLI
jgi:hypothetical protein